MDCEESKSRTAKVRTLYWYGTIGVKDTSGKANSWFADIYFQSVVNISLENSSRIYPSLFTNF
jgi:hypothetical protein